MTIQANVMGLAAATGSPAYGVTADLMEIVELRRERLFDGADLPYGDDRRHAATAISAAPALQRLARQRLGIGTALIDVDNALAFAIDVGAVNGGPQVILYRVIVARALPSHLDLGALFASGEVAAARFAANGIVEWAALPGSIDAAEARAHALRQGATPLGRVFALNSLPAEGGVRLTATGGDPLTLDLVPPSVAGRNYSKARRFAWSETDTPMSYGFGAPAAEQMPGGLAALFATPWQ